MFFSTLSNIPPYTDATYDAIMSTITGDSFNGDRTMVATLRALLFERLNGNSLTFKFLNNDISNEEATAEELTQQLFGDPAPYSIRICDLQNPTPEKYNAAVQKLSTIYDEKTKAREYIKARTEYDGAFFVDEENNSCYILVANLNIRFFHLIQAFMKQFFPRIFAEQPLTDDEKALISIFTQNSSTAYLEKMRELSANHDYRDKIVAIQLDGFEKNCRNAQIDRAQQDLNNCRRETSNYLERYRRSLDSLEEATIRVEGLLAMRNKASDDSALVDYFVSHKNLDLISVEGRTLKFIIRSHLNYFDTDAYECYAKNGDIFKNYSASGVFGKIQNRKTLFNALFNEDPRIRVRMCSYFSIDVAGDVRTESNYHFGAAYQNYLPNPHYQRHACLGQNGPAIIEFLRAGNLPGALEQCIAATQRVNVCEVDATFRPMLRSILESNDKIIETDDGQLLTPEEALQWLKENK